MKNYLTYYFILLFLFVAACSSQTDESTDFFVRVAKLGIQRNDYTLGKTLTDKQKEEAQRNAVEGASPGTYKFKDHAYPYWVARKNYNGGNGTKRWQKTNQKEEVSHHML